MEGSNEQEEFTDLEDFKLFKEKLSQRNSSVTVTNTDELNTPFNGQRRRSSIMIDYFRDNYMGIEVSK